MAKLFYDTETCGLHGPIVLIQYAIDDGEIEVYCPWDEPIQDTIALIEMFMEHTNVGFNLAFDHFHLCQMYTTLLLMSDKSKYLDDCIEEYALKEAQGRFGPCLKPVGCCDLMLHARKTEYQSTMDREDIRIKRVPTQLAWLVAQELSKRIPLKDVYFARKADKTQRWQVMDIAEEDLRVNTDFKDIVLKFAPSAALKTLAQDALGFDLSEILLFHNVEVPSEHHPEELGYAPFCTAIGDPKNWRGAWPVCIKYHINHWLYNTAARQYAGDDVKYTRMLYKYFGALASGCSKEDSRLYSWGAPNEEVTELPVDDDDSVLACMVGAVRWRGFAINVEGIQKLKEACEILLSKLDFNYESTAVVRRYLEAVMTPTEKLVIAKSTKAVIMEDIAKWRKSFVCECGGLNPECKVCNGEGLVETDELHPVALRAREILDARHAKKEIENYNKLLKAGRFHASFKVIGTLSSRMSGADGLNAQGIKRDKFVRQCFPLADNGLVLCGGDFAGFEVVLMDAVYEDPLLREDLTKGKKIHALFGVFVFPQFTYEQIMASKGAKDGQQDYYSRSKQGVFALAYGGEAFTLSTRIGVPEAVAQEAYNKFVGRYKKLGEERKKYFEMFCSMRQPKGLGTKVEWADPADYIASIFDFRRYYTLENMICKALFELAESPPKEWTELKIKVVRRDKEQLICGAVRSALFGAAFAVQAGNMRSAGNHVIQSSGAQMTKALQRRIWDLQPAGIYAWRVQPMNVHDEIMVPTHPDIIPQLDVVRDTFIAEYSKRVPLLEIEWGNRINSWADK
jgi:hypothetical protein